MVLNSSTEIMHRFFEDNIYDNKIELCKENLHHLKNVLRISEEEEFEVVVNGVIYTCRLFEGVAKVESINTFTRESSVKINLFMGLCKGEKMEEVYKRCTEVGVAEFFPVEMERSVVKITGKESKKYPRYKKIIEGAAKQSKREVIPQIHPHIKLKDLEKYIKGDLIVPYEDENTLHLRDALSGEKIVSLVIGPEGGFSSGEIEFLHSIGAKTVSLGRRILRAETAAIVSSYGVLYELERE